MEKIEQFFKFKELQTDIKTEVMAGVTTFAALAYIMVVNPMILSKAGMPFEATSAVTIYMAFIGCMLMGFIGNKPFAIAPMLAENAFLVSTIVHQFGYTWQQAFGAVAISAVILFLLTVLNIRIWLVNSIPACIKYAFTAGLGLYLTFIGLHSSDIVKTTEDGLFIGNFSDINAVLTLTGVLVIAVLMVRGFKLSMLTGLIVVTILSVIFGHTHLPAQFLSAPSDISPLLFKADILGMLNPKAVPIIFIILVVMFFDTMGSMLGVAAKGGFLDKDGNLPDIKKAMISDSSATVIAASMSAITTGVYLESTTGVLAGGKSGLTAVTVGVLFLSGLFLSPVFAIIPSAACNAVLIVIGTLMISVIREIRFEDMTECVPAAMVVFLMTFSANIGIAVASGFILYPILKIIAGKKNELNVPVWILFVISCLFFVFYKF
ncbi:MAG: NCS2 family permease [Candidatus Gastranaerophilales bacterium]|nr:NCS2 family permease [Candidatus Gastranaerophilales bacterium]